MILKQGDSSDDVKALQIALDALGLYEGALDGDFGPKTHKAVRTFQASRGLTVDGIVGPITWNALLKPPARPPWPEPRCWPLRCLADGRKPHVTSGHSSRNPSRSDHHGVDLLYPYRAGDPPKKIGDSGRTPSWWIPENTYSIAPFTGVIVLASDSATGERAWLKHPSGWNAGGFHYDRLVVEVGRQVNIGDPIGLVGDSPRGDDPDHLHFELYLGDIVDDVRHGRYPRGSIDPELMLATTPYLPAQ